MGLFGYYGSIFRVLVVLVFDGGGDFVAYHIEGAVEFTAAGVYVHFLIYVRRFPFAVAWLLFGFVWA